MTTETTTNLPPCPLPDCKGSEHHHYHNINPCKIGEGHDCAEWAALGYRCYSQHRPGLSEPISLPEVTDEMVEWARNRSMIDTFGELHSFAVAIRLALLAAIPQWQPIERDQIRPGMRVKRTHKGVQMTLTVATRDATAVGTAEGWLLPLTSGTWQVDSSTIPDPDAGLIEKLARLLDALENAREVIAAVRAHDEAVTGNE